MFPCLLASGFVSGLSGCWIQPGAYGGLEVYAAVSLLTMLSLFQALEPELPLVAIPIQLEEVGACSGCNGSCAIASDIIRP